MPYPPRPIAPELITEARRLYEQTNVPVRDIAALIGLGERTLYARIYKWKWAMRCDRIPRESPPPPINNANAGTVAPAIAAAPAPVSQLQVQLDEAISLPLRLQRAVERELAAVEALIRKLGVTPEPGADAERTARTLASLSRTLREMSTLQEKTSKPGDPDDESVSAGSDELQRELLERLDKIVAQRADGISGEPEQG